MYDRLLIPTDGSDEATVAVEFGLDIASVTGASAELLFVVDTRLDDFVESEETSAVFDQSEKAGRQLTADIAERTENVDIDRSVRNGIPHEVINSHASDTDADLMVLGTAGGGRSRLGSTAERVVTNAEMPVITVPGESANLPGSVDAITDIVIASDGSDAADRAAETAIHFAEYFGATIHAIYVVDTAVYDLADAPRSIIGLLREGGETVIEEITSDATTVSIPNTGNILRGRPAKEIHTYADGVSADLIVVGTRGRSDLPKQLMGSTTRRVISNASRPVLSRR